MRRFTILLVDDEERYLATMTKLLAQRDLTAFAAPGGAAALEILDREPVDVVILDVKMPGMDGLAVLKRIRARHPLVEVIMLTGHGSISTAVEGMRNGAYDYLTKPCDVDELIARAADAFEKKERAEERIREAQLRKAISSPRGLVREIERAQEEER